MHLKLLFKGVKNKTDVDSVEANSTYGHVLYQRSNLTPTKKWK